MNSFPEFWKDKHLPEFNRDEERKPYWYVSTYDRKNWLRNHTHPLLLTDYERALCSDSMSGGAIDLVTDEDIMNNNKFTKL